jgi:hypothetical protein
LECTHNAATWKDAGIAQEMICYEIDIMALQEMRWQGTGRTDTVKFTITYSGSQKRTRQLGTGFMITRKMKARMPDYDKSVCKIRMKGKCINISIISVHAPREEKEEREREREKSSMNV